MEPDIRYRAAALLIVVALLSGGFLFLEAAKRYGEVQLPWTDLPVEVRAAIRREAGPEPTIVQVEKGPSSPEPTFSGHAGAPGRPAPTPATSGGRYPLAA